MNTVLHLKAQAVADGRLATSAQPPRAPRSHQLQVSFGVTSQAVRSCVFGDQSGALRVGLLCFTASRPLPTPTLLVGKPSPEFDLNARSAFFQLDRIFH